MSEPKVLQLVTGLGVGGAERVVVELASAMVAEGSPAQVLALNDDAGLLEQYPNLPFPYDSLGMSKNVFSFFRALGRLNRFVRREKITVIHAHMFHALVLALCARLRRPRIKIVFTSHNFGGFGGIRGLFVRITKRLRDTDIVFSADQHVEINASRTVVIKNAVQVPELSSGKTRADRPFTFLFLGRFETQKNPVAMIRAFAEMQSMDCRLVMAGDGYLRTEVEQAIAAAGVGERVRLPGVVKDVPALLAGVDCLVLSSSWEGLPMVVLEAGARGLPAIATPVGSLPELLADGCGYLCELPQLAPTMDEVASDPKAARARGARLYEKIQTEHSLAGMARRHREVYASV